MATTTPANVFPAGIKPFAERKFPKTIVMFDVDDTLTPPRRKASAEMQEALVKLRQLTTVAFVGGSDFGKISEQLQVPGQVVIDNFDYCFAENGLVAYKLGKELASNSFIQHVGEDEYKKMVNWTLRYLADVDIPFKRGTFIEFRRGMVNISPVGRNASNDERAAFEAHDKIHNIRKTMVETMRKEFAHLNLTFSIGGMISFDVFPKGWDKTYSLNHIEDEGFEDIHFFGDKTFVGGNDHEIFSDERTIGHTVTSPQDTLRQLNELFFSKA